MWKEETLEKFKNNKQRACLGGGQDRIDAQHKKSKLTARERLALLFDNGEYNELGVYVESRINDFGANTKRASGDGVVCAYGLVNGRLTFATSEDFTVFGGTMGEYHLRKICELQDKALIAKAPLVMINDSGGARIEEGISSLAEMGGMFLRNTKASGIIPQIAVIMGPCAGGACYSPAICDFIFMVEKTGQMYITGPAVIKTATYEDCTAEELGGTKVHSTVSGVSHFVYNDDASCIEGVRQLLSYLPQNNETTIDITKTIKETKIKLNNLQDIVLEDKKKSYDIRDVIKEISDDDSFFEVQREYAKNAVIGFARMDGKNVGYVCNQPNFLAGAIECDSSDKIARFVRFCDCFNIPLVTLVDVPAYLPGMNQEQKGIIRHGAKVLFAYSEATVPKITIILRKAYGGAYIAMCSKNLGADVVYAWPIAEIAVMSAEGAISIIGRKQLKESTNPELDKQKMISEYEQKFLNPYTAAARGYVDEVIHPDETRQKIIDALKMLKDKTHGSVKQHGNIPL